jgi:glycosyltransferase involved in cell wall biosynthesis
MVSGLKIGLVGPLPPPSGGMANQTRQLAHLLTLEGVEVEVVQVNAPYRPRWIESARGLRALFRLIPYLIQLWRVAGRVHLFHVMANSGWAWHLYAAPAIGIGKLRGVPIVLNYRGGNAEQFFQRSFFWVAPTMKLADRLIVPSGFLQQVFSKFGLVTEVVPNIIDLARFAPDPGKKAARTDGPHIIVTRNLESIYDIGTALRALAIVKNSWAGVRMTVAGSGPERDALIDLTQVLDLKENVCFSGRLDNEQMAQVYHQADLFVNPSLVDNMPISILEALASGVPVVTTDVGGIPFLVEHERTALLVSSGDARAMAAAVLDLLGNPQKANRLASAGCDYVQRYSWQSVRGRLFDVYSALVLKTEKGAAGLIK